MNNERLGYERLGLETRFQTREELEPLTEINNALKKLRDIDREGNSPKLRRALVTTLREYCGLEAGAIDAEREYAHLEASISSANEVLNAYLRDVLVADLLQRVSITNEVESVTDPLTLVDVLLSSRDPRTRFEARSALHFGALF
ncbi:MAG: hypothetical protein AAB855_00630, partial [Patescibacteria group bacterium]